MLKRRDPRLVADAPVAEPGYRRMFLLALCFWTAIVTISSFSAVLRGFAYQWVVNVPVDVMLIVYAALVALGVYALLRRVVSLAPWKQLAVVTFMVALIAGPFELGFNFLLSQAPKAHTMNLSYSLEPKKLLQGGLFWVVPWSLWSAATLAMLHNIESRLRERRLAALQWEAHEAQVRALRYQVNPHFLYNTLSSISTLILEGKSDVAERMIMRLSAFFRTSLAQDPFQDVPLADELELQRLYLEIEQVRFADNLSVEYDVPDKLKDALVPSLILQPLVENSIKHGLQEAGKRTTLTISARSVRDRLVLEVADNGPGPGASGGTGVGLRNVERRLVTRFGPNCRVEANGGAQGGFQVRLEMPLVFAS